MQQKNETILSHTFCQMWVNLPDTIPSRQTVFTFFKPIFFCVEYHFLGEMKKGKPLDLTAFIRL